MMAAWWWIDRWRKSTAYTDMTAEAQGVYRNLLDELWLRGGAIPNDDRILAKIGGDFEAWPRVRQTVLARFRVTPEGLRNETHDEVMAGAVAARERQRAKGRLRAEKASRGPAGTFQPAIQPAIQPETSLPSPDPDPSQTQTPETNLSTRETRERGCGGEGETEPAASPPVVPSALTKLTEVFNAIYGRRVKPPALNGVAEKHLRTLVRAYGEDGAACLPLLAWMHDTHSENARQRIARRAVSHLLHDGTRGAFEWSALLQQCDALNPEASTVHRIWAVAREHGIGAALERLGAPLPRDRPVLQAEPPPPPPRPVELAKEALARIRRERQAEVEREVQAEQEAYRLAHQAREVAHG